MLYNALHCLPIPAPIRGGGVFSGRLKYNVSKNTFHVTFADFEQNLMGQCHKFRISWIGLVVLTLA
jgi:hypothetical protein